MKKACIKHTCESLVKVCEEKNIIFHSQPKSPPAVLLKHIQRAEERFSEESSCNVFSLSGSWLRLNRKDAQHLTLISVEWSKSLRQSVFPLCSFLSAAKKTRTRSPSKQFQFTDTEKLKKGYQAGGEGHAVLRVTVYDPIRWRQYIYWCAEEGLSKKYGLVCFALWIDGLNMSICLQNEHFCNV